MISVVTNIDPEHMNFYKSFERMKLAYKFFLDNTSFFGFCVVCTDHPVVSQMAEKVTDREVISYGFNENALVRAVNERTEKGIQIFDVIAFGKEIKNIQLPLLGRHNIQNALAAIAVGLKLEISEENIKKALASFEGVERRFSKRGTSHGVHIYDDYGHHPVEIKAVLKAAKSAVGEHKLLAVFEPHRYTRALDLANEFSTAFEDADTVFVADIFSAGEEAIPEISKDILAQKIKASGHPNVFVLPSWNELPEMILKHTSVGDFVVGLGAGDVSKYMKNLPDEMEQL
jgi:UDP-N-acetylmuramate--alanine ligase